MKPIPKTPLPWTKVPIHPDYKNILYPISIFDSDYILHACNAYPKLVALLEDIRISGTAYSEHAEDLLKELREL